LSKHIQLFLDDKVKIKEEIITPEEFSIQYEISISSKELGETVRRAIYEHAVVTHPVFGQVFAFEVDCFGSQVLMDDANTPSLLSLLGFLEKNDTIYKNTRDMILSEGNPWYFKGSFAQGIGGPHTGQNMVWPMSLLMQIQTSTNESEVIELIDVLKRLAKRTGNLMCESFDVNKPSTFTRSWFSWANGLAGTTILQVIQDYPHLA
jgi:meiotically up-regulated gene 157 (Mug157) protein